MRAVSGDSIPIAIYGSGEATNGQRCSYRGLAWILLRGAGAATQLNWEVAMPLVKIEAEPATLSVDLGRTALIIIDMQRDFLEPGGFGGLHPHRDLR